MNQTDSYTSALYISLEFTPNPNTLKYSVNRTLFDQGAANFVTLDEARLGSPLAAKLFEIPGIAGVMIGKDFLTVTKTQDGDWDKVHQMASKTLDEYLRTTLPLFTEDFLAGRSTKQSLSGSETENKIKEILDKEIRPAVAMDGGDVVFDRFENGVVYLFMQGSCAGCPSSKMTLKMGIETRLREALPEIKEVVSVA
jgi:Fe-S cluster biogenesis protein NfuA